MRKQIVDQLMKSVAAAGVLVSRLGALPYNFSPLGSFGFFGGGLIQFFGSIIIFDLLRGGTYPGQIFTYLGFFSYWLLGKIARGSSRKQVALLPVASFLFFLISNLGVWMFWYPPTLAGLIACYLAALPFYRNTLLGDLVFGYAFLIAKAVVFRGTSSYTKNLLTTD